jgi:excisionase family DNA binding protein
MINHCGRVKVIHGATDGIFEVAGASVESVQASVVDAFNVPAWAIAFVNGTLVGGRRWLLPNDVLEFVMPWGRKGAEVDPPAPRLLTVKEAAEEMRCSISFIYKLMETGQLAFERRGRRKLPTAESVAEYRQRNTVAANRRPTVKPRTPYQFKYLFQDK